VRARRLPRCGRPGLGDDARAEPLGDVLADPDAVGYAVRPGLTAPMLGMKLVSTTYVEIVGPDIFPCR
jgi:hypothetical protein